jgi:hypothetical protein
MKKAVTPAAESDTSAVLTEPRVTPKEAGRLLGRCTKTVLTLVKDKKIQPVFRNATSGPGAIEIPISSIRSFQQSLLIGVKKRGGK